MKFMERDSGTFWEDLVRKEFRVCNFLCFPVWILGSWASGGFRKVYLHVFMFLFMLSWFIEFLHCSFSYILCFDVLGGGREASIGPSRTVNICMYLSTWKWVLDVISRNILHVVFMHIVCVSFMHTLHVAFMYISIGIFIMHILHVIAMRVCTRGR